jgi:hypothetical protein
MTQAASAASAGRGSIHHAIADDDNAGSKARRPSCRYARLGAIRMIGRQAHSNSSA